MKRGIKFLLAASLVLLAGCSAKTISSTDQSPPTPIQVSYSTTPASPVKAGQQVKLSVSVQQNGAPVEDADEVKFEVWKENQTPHEMIPAKSGKNGEYYIEKTFADAGQYFVMYHVTARDVHNMQKKELKVE